MDGGSSALYGTFTPRLDDKFRLTLPAQFRAHFAGGIIMTAGQEHCLYGWAPREFSVYEQRMSNQSFADATSRKILRFMYANQMRETPDKQGRVGIPSHLRSWASLDRDCAVVGTLDRIEIWDAQAWADFQDAEGPAYAALNEDLMNN